MSNDKYAVLDAELLVFEPGNSSDTPADADTTIPASDLGKVSIQQKLQDKTDSASITVRNNTATRSSDYSDKIQVGDRLMFRRKLEGDSSLSERWQGLVGSPNWRVNGPTDREIDLRSVDFVFGILNNRQITEVYEDVQIAGTSSSIINDIISQEASEIGTSQINSITDTRRTEFQRTGLMKALGRVLEEYPFFMTADGQDLVVKEKTAPSAQFTWQSSDRQGEWNHQQKDDSLINNIVVDGVLERALDVEQTSSDSTETVTDTNRRTQQINARKESVARWEVSVSPKGTSSDDLIVRLQKDDGNGNPANPGDFNSDIDRQTIPSDELVDGFNAVDFVRDHGLGNYDPHVLVEASGSDGHDVRYDSGSGDMKFKHYYWFKNPIESEASGSVDKYRRYDGRYKRETIRGRSEGADLSYELLAKHQVPTGRIEWTAKSQQAQDLSPGDVVRVNEPDVNATGPYMVTKTTEVYDPGATDLQTDVTMVNRGSV